MRLEEVNEELAAIAREQHILNRELLELEHRYKLAQQDVRERQSALKHDKVALLDKRELLLR